MEVIKNLFGQNSLKAGSHSGISCHLMASRVYDTCCERLSTAPSSLSWSRSLCSKQLPSTLPYLHNSLSFCLTLLSREPSFIPWPLHSYVWHFMDFTFWAAQIQPRMMGISPKADNMIAVELIYVHLGKNKKAIAGMFLNKSSSFCMYRTFCTSEPD